VAEVAYAVAQAGVPLRRAAGLARDPRGAGLLSGTWGGKLDRTLLLRSAREVAGQLVAAPAPGDDRKKTPRTGGTPAPSGQDPSLAYQLEGR
jgi:hypothetical protein